MTPRIRPKREEDMPALIRALESTYATDGYPVQGTADAAIFISPPETEKAWVVTDDADTAVGQIILESATLINKQEMIVGKSGHRALLQSWIDLGHDLTETTIAARFFIRKDARGLGMGKRLVMASVEWAKANGMRVILNVLEKDPAL